MKTQAPIENLISAYLDGELPDQRQAELYRELMRDPDMRDQLDQQSQLERELTVALRAEIDATPMKPLPRRRSPLSRFQIVATAAVVLLALGLTVITAGNASRLTGAALRDAAQAQAVVSLDEIQTWWRSDGAALNESPFRLDEIANDLGQAGQNLVGVLDHAANRVVFYEVQARPVDQAWAIGEL